jgi:hypothetical protein
MGHSDSGLPYTGPPVSFRNFWKPTVLRYSMPASDSGVPLPSQIQTEVVVEYMSLINGIWLYFSHSFSWSPKTNKEQRNESNKADKIREIREIRKTKGLICRASMRACVLNH